MFSRLTPQALYYLDSDALTHKLVIIEERSGSEVVLRRDYEEVQHSMLLRVNQDKPMTGAFLEESDWVSDDVDYAYEAVIAMRTARGYQRSLALISDRDLPPLREVFDGLLENDATAVEPLLRIAECVRNGGDIEGAQIFLRHCLEAAPRQSRRLWEAWWVFSAREPAPSPAEMLGRFPGRPRAFPDQAGRHAGHRAF